MNIYGLQGNGERKGYGGNKCTEYLTMEVQNERGGGEEQDLYETSGGLGGVSINVWGRSVRKL